MTRRRIHLIGPTFLAWTFLFTGIAFLSPNFSVAQQAGAGPANSDPTYVALRNVTLSGETLNVSNLELKRDQGNFILKTGTLYFLSPVGGKVTGAVFVGEGVFQLAPFMPSERHSLTLLTKNDEGVIKEEFNEAVFRFTEGTYTELKSKGPLARGVQDSRASGVLSDTRSNLRHKIQYNLEGRILEDVLSTQPGGLFVAFIKGKKYSGKMIFAIDPHGLGEILPFSVAPEEVALATSDDNKMGVWFASHLMSEFKSGEARSDQQNGLFRIKSHNLDVTIERSGKLEGVATTTVQPLTDGLRVLQFNLFPSLRVQNVTDSAGQALSFIQEDKDEDPQYFVILNKPLSQKETIVLKTTYAGKDAVRNEGGGNYFPVARENWYPNTRFGDYAMYDMTFHIPKGLTMVASGTRISEKDEGNQNVSVWRSEAPEAVAGFNFGKFKMESAKNEQLGFTFESFANKEEPAMIRDLQNQIQMLEQQGVQTNTTLQSINTTGLIKKALAEAELSVNIYTQYFGPLPYKRLAMTQQTAMNFGQSWPTLVYLPISSFFDSTIRHQLGMDETKGDFFKVVGPHEVAHQWWGHAVGFDSYRDQWMSEGFAEFSASLYVQTISKNPKEFIKFWNDERDLLAQRNQYGFRAIDVGPVTMGYRLSNTRSGMEVTRNLIYPKGAYILHMIRMMMWDRQTADQPFIEMMKDFVKTYESRVATTEDFKAMVEKHMTPGMNLNNNGKIDWFFNEYVYGTALPHYEIQATFAPDGQNGVLMNVKMTQSDVPDNFEMAVPLYLELADGRITRLGSIKIIGNSTFEQAIPLRGIKDKPKRVMVNYYDDVLCTQ